MQNGYQLKQDKQVFGQRVIDLRYYLTQAVKYSALLSNSEKLWLNLKQRPIRAGREMT
jgi:hypothetical protein